MTTRAIVSIVKNGRIESKFGCIDCLVVMNDDDIIFKGDEDEESSSLYRETFDNPSFNPRWNHYGIAENVIILKIDEPVNNVIEELKNWMFDVDTTIVDDVLEFLHDHQMLNDSGEKLKHEFWEKYVKSDKMTKIKECILGTNGMVMSFDDNDEQIPECQGFILDIADKLKDNCDENTKWIFGGPGKGILDANLNWYWKKKKDERG